MSVFLLVLAILLFIGLVLAHEWGHFVVARRNGVEVEEFGLGFPPHLWKKRVTSKKGKWIFSINLLPLGGFVKLKGEHDTDTEPGSFGAASLWAKSKIMVAGVFMNLVVAIGLLMIIAWLGMPRLINNQFTVKSDAKAIKSEILAGYVEPGSPAAKAGLKLEDRILALGPAGHAQTLSGSQSLIDMTQKYAGERVVIRYDHNGQEHQATVTLRTNAAVNASRNTAHPQGHLGVVPDEFILQRSTWSAPIVALGLTKQLTVLTAQGIWHAVDALGHGNTAKASAQVAGPVGIFVILKHGTLLGYQFVLMIIAIVSLTLAIMNILPIPALDGGRLWLMLITRGLKQPLSAKKEELINAAGFVFLMVLVVLITAVDIRRFF